MSAWAEALEAAMAETRRIATGEHGPDMTAKLVADLEAARLRCEQASIDVQRAQGKL